MYTLRLLYPISHPAILIRNLLIDTKSTLFSIPSLTRKLKNLELQNHELLIISQKYTALEKELATYRSNPTKNFTILPATLISSSDNSTISLSDTSLLRPGEAVVSGNILIGTIKEIAPHTATITLVSNQKTPLAIITQNNLTGTFITTNSNPTIEGIDNTKPLPEGTAVFTKSNLNLPGNLLIGKVKAITSKPSDTSQSALLELAINPFTATNLFVIVDF